eukprot:3939039-Rhodomonas_salina.2
MSTQACDACGTAHVCVQNNRTRCPPGMTTDTAFSGVHTDCRCAAGWYKRTPATCQRCQAGFFCSDGVHQTPCTGFSDSAPPRTSVTDCRCAEGQYTGSVFGFPCAPCAENNYCSGGVSHVCPVNSWSPPGAEHEGDCICDTFFFDNASDPRHTKCVVDEALPTCQHLTVEARSTIDLLELGFPGGGCRTYPAGSTDHLIIQDVVAR